MKGEISESSVKGARVISIVYFVSRVRKARNQTERGHGPIIVMEMARARPNGESSLVNSVISNQGSSQARVANRSRRMSYMCHIRWAEDT